MQPRRRTRGSLPVNVRLRSTAGDRKWPTGAASENGRHLNSAMSFFGAGAASSTLGASTSAAATERDIEVSDPPDDSISCLEFCPVADYLAVGSWNNQVRRIVGHGLRTTEIGRAGSNLRSRSKWADTGQGHVPTRGSCAVCVLEQGKSRFDLRPTRFRNTYPSRHVPQDGNKIFSGGADKAGRAFDVSTGQSSQVAQHDAPIKCVKWIEAPTGGILATGSWDKTVKV